jgi:hypothetical protein
MEVLILVELELVVQELAAAAFVSVLLAFQKTEGHPKSCQFQ